MKSMTLRSCTARVLALLTLSMAALCPAAEWKAVDGTKIPVPPTEHPRLYLRASEAAQMKSRLEDPSLKGAVASLRAQAKTSAQAGVEWNAIQYLATRD